MLEGMSYNFNDFFIINENNAMQLKKKLYRFNRIAHTTA